MSTAILQAAFSLVSLISVLVMAWCCSKYRVRIRELEAELGQTRQDLHTIRLAWAANPRPPAATPKEST